METKYIGTAFIDKYYPALLWQGSYWFDKATALEVAKDHTYSDEYTDQKCWYDEATDTFMFKDYKNFAPHFVDKFPGKDIETDEGVKHMYSFCTWFWYESDKDGD